jgi:hypothetical protein
MSHGLPLTFELMVEATKQRRRRAWNEAWTGWVIFSQG